MAKETKNTKEVKDEVQNVVTPEEQKEIDDNKVLVGKEAIDEAKKEMQDAVKKQAKDDAKYMILMTMAQVKNVQAIMHRVRHIDKQVLVPIAMKKTNDLIAAIEADKITRAEWEKQFSDNAHEIANKLREIDEQYRKELREIRHLIESNDYMIAHGWNDSALRDIRMALGDRFVC